MVQLLIDREDTEPNHVEVHLEIISGMGDIEMVQLFLDH